MKLFKCQSCQQVLYFENSVCVKCGHRLGYVSEIATLSALEPDGDLWRALAAAGGAYRFCANAAQKACNWLVEASSLDSFCLSCRHNRTIPDVTLPPNLEAWQKIEIAKHRLFYSLLRLRLPMPTRVEDPAEGLAFDFLAELPQLDAAPVMTGHDNGLITISLAEADDAAREQRRVAMHEPYRTLLGHFRHETGHYFWDRLVRDRDQLDASIDFDPYRAPGMVPLIHSWLPLSLALNSLNRAMGQSDLYPFVLSQPAIDKLGFVHKLVHTT